MPIENRPEEPPATRRMNCPPSHPTPSPIRAPPASSATASPSRAYHVIGSAPGTLISANATTRMTTGASLKPDSASSMPVIRRGSGTVRNTEKTAAASVDASTAPTSAAVSNGIPST